MLNFSLGATELLLLFVLIIGGVFLMLRLARRNSTQRLQMFCTIVMLASAIGLICSAVSLWDKANSPRAIAAAIPLSILFAAGLIARCSLESPKD